MSEQTIYDRVLVEAQRALFDSTRVEVPIDRGYKLIITEAVSATLAAVEAEARRRHETYTESEDYYVTPLADLADWLRQQREGA